METTWSADTSQRLESPHVSAERTRRWFWLPVVVVVVVFAIVLEYNYVKC